VEEPVLPRGGGGAFVGVEAAVDDEREAGERLSDEPDGGCDGGESYGAFGCDGARAVAGAAADVEPAGWPAVVGPG
jgi:hypothetical protein